MSKHARMRTTNKRLGAASNAKATAEALSIANSFMPTNIHNWDLIPKEETEPLKTELIRMRDYIDELQEHWAPKPESV